MLAAIGEFERDLIKERAADGIARAKANGVKFGAKRKLSEGDIANFLRHWNDPECNRAEVARAFGISRSTGYRIADEAGTEASVDAREDKAGS